MYPPNMLPPNKDYIGYKTFSLIIQLLWIGIFLIGSQKHPDRYRR